MERFYLITNRAKDPDLTVTDQIRQSGGARKNVSSLR